MLGVMIMGFQRAVFSNEAGIGSAAIAHSAVKTQEPVTEGFVGLMEPFIDTVVICTLTALVILTTVYEPELAGAGMQGIELTTRAFGDHSYLVRHSTSIYSDSVCVLDAPILVVLWFERLDLYSRRIQKSRGMFLRLFSVCLQLSAAWFN